MNDDNSEDEWARICDTVDIIEEQLLANRHSSAGAPSVPPVPTNAVQQQHPVNTYAANGYSFSGSQAFAPQENNNRTSARSRYGAANSFQAQRTNPPVYHRQATAAASNECAPTTNYGGITNVRVGSQQTQDQRKVNYRRPEPYRQANILASNNPSGSQIPNLEVPQASQYNPASQQPNFSSQPAVPSAAAAPSARDYAAVTGALENYKRRLAKLEQDNIELRKQKAALAIAPPPPQQKPSDDRTMVALKNDLATARTAQRKAEQRAEFAERELASREEQSEFIEATQFSAPVRSQGISMSRTTPVHPKRRRVSSSSQLPPPSAMKTPQKPPVITRPSQTPVLPNTPQKPPAPVARNARRPRAVKEVCEADWEVPHAGWLDEYDSTSRRSERIRAVVFTPPRVRALMKLAGRDEPMEAILQNVLACGDEEVWRKLRNALTTELVEKRAGGAVVEILHALRMNAGDWTRGELGAACTTAIIDLLKRNIERNACLELLAIDESPMVDSAAARIVHDDLRRYSEFAVQWMGNEINWCGNGSCTQWWDSLRKWGIERIRKSSASDDGRCGGGGPRAR